MHKESFKYLLLALFAITFLSACDNSIDINDEYKEITIVYGLLDPSETTHYVKVSKAFLSEENIYLAAADPKYSQYGPDDLEVWIEQFNADGSVAGNVIYLDTCVITNKDAGIFFFPEQIVYKTPDNKKLDPALTYKLSIKNVNTGKLIEAETDLIGDVRLTKPNPHTSQLSLTGTSPIEMKWINGDNAYVYDVGFRFFYTEINATGDTASKYVDWDQGTVRVTKPEVDGTYLGPAFYTYLENSIEAPTPGMVRFMDSVHLVLYAGNEDLSIYMDVNAPSTSIVQERPQYTNISNGMGIFASRFRYTKTFKQLTDRSLDTLHLGAHTRNLGFQERP